MVGDVQVCLVPGRCAACSQFSMMHMGTSQSIWDVPICIIENCSQERLVEILEGIDFPDKVKYFFSNQLSRHC